MKINDSEEECSNSREIFSAGFVVTFIYFLKWSEL
jgi:hypothetical protein